ncbi:MAG: DNA recombination protein RmuC [Bryobacteraceae bacterium]
MEMTLLAGILFALLVGAAAFCAYEFGEARRWRADAAEWKAEAERLRGDMEEAKRRAIQQEAESAKNRELAETQWKLLTQTQQQLEEKFRALASQALQENSQMLLDRSREQIHHVVEPVSASLRRFEEQVQAVEKTRVGAYEGVLAQVRGLTEMQERVRQSMDQLKNALRSPSQRGQWGEIQLRRAVEFAGMLEHCDFAEQKTLFGDTNQRPDLIVHLPNECHVVVDAKVSLDAYLRAAEAEDEGERARLLALHAEQVRKHVKSLADKAYWRRLPCAPEFVVAFLPLESLFSAALEQDPELLSFGVQNRVILATPTTLISLLLAVAHGWRQQALAEDVEKVRAAGVDLYNRILTMSDHFERLGSAIGKSVETFNQTVGSMQRTVLPAARKFSELRPADARELPEFEVIEITPRSGAAKG